MSDQRTGSGTTAPSDACTGPDASTDTVRAAFTRRDVLRGAAAAAGLGFAAPFVNLGRYRLRAEGRREYSQRCIDLVTGSLVIDMLGLTTLNSEVRARWGPDFSGLTEADAQEFRDSEIDVFHIARGVGGRTTEGS